MILRLHIAYDGTGFHGWQAQPDGVKTVQGSINAALARFLNIDESEVQLQGASRTDAGVHALGQVASLRFDDRREVWDYVRALNALTPDSISINHGQVMADGFNARHDSHGKRYEYRIWNHRFVHPLLRHRTWSFRHELDLGLMQEAASYLVGEHDFSAFRASDCQQLSTVRQMWRVDVTKDGPDVRIVVEGSAFLKNMVRIMAGTLAEIGCGQLPPDAVLRGLESGNRADVGMTAQPQGLTLQEVFYPEHPWDVEPSIGCWQKQ
ncbi:MAG: tRNA pseudouridine(38-40) synthase TruA [bacterium]